MKAVVHAGNGRVRVDDVAAPRLSAPTDAILRVRRAAICGTDLHVLAHADEVPKGFVLGHEYVGEITEAGAGVRGHRVGDLVFGSDFASCGRCWFCRHGDHWECPERRFFGTGSLFGAPLSGAQAEYLRVPFADTVLAALPEGVDPDAAVFLGDTLATGYAAIRRARLEPGETVAVVGGGPVGQLVSLAAQACGAGVVALGEPVPARRETAAREGALTAEPGELRALLDDLTDSRGADVVVDAIGGRAGLHGALDLVRRRGRIVSVGVPAGDMVLPQRAFVDELSVSFAVGDSVRDADALLALVRAGAIDPRVLATRRAALSEAVEAYRETAERRTLKVILDT